MWSFEIQWPAPFSQDWCRSGREFATTKDAGDALAEYLAISADNGTLMLGRLVRVSKL